MSQLLFSAYKSPAATMQTVIITLQT